MHEGSDRSPRAPENVGTPGPTPLHAAAFRGHQHAAAGGVVSPRPLAAGDRRSDDARPGRPQEAHHPPGLTACSLCSGETLGTSDTLPGGQSERLRRLAEDGTARLTFVECLDECERGDVVVARPTGACRRAGATPVWFERLAGDEATVELASWLRAGGPGSTPLPQALEDLVITRGGDEPRTADARA